MATTGAANSFVLNITELQNTVTTATGLSPFETLNLKIEQIENMVIVDEKRIAVNTISAFSSTPIQVNDPMNIGPTGGLSVSGQVVGGAGAAGPTGPTGPGPYTPTVPSYWATNPASLTEAVERMASLLYTLNGGNPIP
jgi:hypothetical protein